MSRKEADFLQIHPVCRSGLLELAPDWGPAHPPCVGEERIGAALLHREHQAGVGPAAKLHCIQGALLPNFLESGSLIWMWQVVTCTGLCEQHLSHQKNIDSGFWFWLINDPAKQVQDFLWAWSFKWGGRKTCTLPLTKKKTQKGLFWCPNFKQHTKKCRAPIPTWV